MLEEHFEEIWFAGELDEDGLRRLREGVVEVFMRGGRRVKLRFYLEDPSGLQYFEVLRKLLLDNTVMTIVVEDRGLDKLLEDASRAGAEPTLVVKGLPSDLLASLRDMGLRVVEVGSG